MLRGTLTSALRPALRNSRGVIVNTTIRGMAEGSTGSGASRAGGAASGDAYTRREKANEDYYVKEQEKEKLRALQAKLKEQSEHIKKLDQHIQDITKEQGGEHN
ncbi:MAG: hypothetical protein M1825_005050 [Sarcosagium campestre]|nr:MAG: hypothetical protein M1825_005050 [Sarcosagium campestre]